MVVGRITAGGVWLGLSFFGCGYAAPGSSAVSFMLAMLAQHSSPIVRSKPLLFGSMQSAIG